MSETWLHIQWSMFGAWLPGDPRGFRNHQGRIVSTGNYKDPPPPREHAGLRRYARSVARRDEVVLDPALRTIVRDAIIEKAADIGLKVGCLAVARTHVHLPAWLERAALNQTVGRLKRFSSHRVRHAIPGVVWAARCHAVAIRDHEHHRAAVRYVLAHGREEGPRSGPNDRGDGSGGGS